MSCGCVSTDVSGSTVWSKRLLLIQAVRVSTFYWSWSGISSHLVADDGHYYLFRGLDRLADGQVDAPNPRDSGEYLTNDLRSRSVACLIIELRKINKSYSHDS